LQAISKLRQRISRIFEGNFIRNLGWLGLGQAAIRVTRLAATVLLPRFLTQDDYGMAALVLAIYEFTQTFTRIGIHARIIQSTDDEIEEIANSCYWLNWVIYGGLFVVQLLIAFPIAWFYHESRLILPLAVLALTYLITPFGRVQDSLIQREKRLKVTSAAQALRYGIANVLTAIFAVLGMGMWAIVLPILLTVPLEFGTYLKQCSWRCRVKFTTHRWGHILKFGVNLLGMQLLKTLRENLDYLIIGKFLGFRELGLYYFAYNAGLGFSLTVIQSITTAMYPQLCEVRERLRDLRQTYLSTLKTSTITMTSFVALQTLAAPFYVPILFGEKWIPAIPILVLICLSAIPRVFDVGSFLLLTAIGKPNLGLLWSVFFTVAFTIALLIGVQWQAMGVAIAVLGIHILCVPIFSVATIRYVFKPLRHQPPGSAPVG
jgi:teichuronic acid exporter